MRHHVSVLRDLRRHDTQSHGHFHHVYRDPESNRINLERADRILRELRLRAASASRLRTVGGSQASTTQLEDLGYLYSSDFQLGYDDFPFYPWKRDRFSRVLQIPIHPGLRGPVPRRGRRRSRGHRRLPARLVPSKLDAGELAIVYGHPERRLAADARGPRRSPRRSRTSRWSGEQPSRSWRAGGDGAAERRWLVIPRDDHRLEIQFDEWDSEYRPRPGDPPRSVPLLVARDRSTDVPAARRPGVRADRGIPAGPWPAGRSIAGSPSLKQAVRAAHRLGDRDSAGGHPAVVDLQPRQARPAMVESTRRAGIA